MSVSQDCQQFLDSRKSLVLSTISAQGELETSVMPFVVVNAGELAIFVSELSAHTQNLLNLTGLAQNAGDSNFTGLVSGLLLADENETPEIFARERIGMQLQVSRVDSGSVEWQEIVDRFAANFGEVVDVLRNLPDFHCFKLVVVRGRYVRGFGAAYAFEGCPCKEMQGIKGR